MQDAIVIGAGLAGLAAARRLTQNGAGVTVLEARDRAGGRVLSEPVAGGPVIDLGAQFLGDVQGRISALVDAFGLTRVAPEKGGDALFLPAGAAAPKRFREDAPPLSLLGKLDALQADWRLRSRLAAFRRGEHGALDRRTAARTLHDLAFTSEARAFFSAFAEGEFCVSLDEISAHELLEQLTSVGGREGEAGSVQWFLAEGAGSLVRALADPIASSIVTGAAVTRIAQDADGVRVEAATGTYRAASLIVTTPPQLYDALGLMAQLPLHRQQALTRFRVGSVVKTILVFESPWWRNLGLSGAILAPGAPCNAAVDASIPGAQRGVLVLFSTGPSGRMLGQTRSEAGRIARLLDWLAKLTGAAVPAPVAARSVDWSGDPWSLGGYASRRAPGAWASAPDLFAPHGRIHFAGTETASAWRSFMEGALESGERAAQAVLAA